MDYKKLAEDIKRCAGGEGNITSATNCATRLRLTLADEAKADDEAVKKLKGVMGLVKQGGQYQIIIGQDVGSVAKYFHGNSGEGADNVPEKKKFDLLGVIAGCFTPVLPAMTAAGMLSALLALASAFGMDTEGTNYIVLNGIADAAFYFLPIYIGFSAAKKFQVNPYMAAFLGGILVHPELMGIEGLSLFGLPITPTTYSSSVIPIMLGVAFMSLVEPVADKVSPTPVKFFLKPLLTLIVVAPVTLVVLGPLGGIIGKYVSIAIVWINANLGWATSALIGALCPLLVMTGMHYAIMPVVFQQFSSMGFDSIMAPGMLCANVAQGAAGLAVACKTKNKDLRALAGSTGLTGVLGITEPVMYGVNLKLKKPFYAVMLAGGCGGLVAGLFGVKSYALASPGVAAIAIFLGGDGLHNFIGAIVSIVVSCAVAFIAAWILGFDDPEEEHAEDAAEKKAESPAGGSGKRQKAVTVTSPLEGQAVDLSSVSDPTFAEGMLGQGIAVIPEKGEVRAPFDGTVTAIFPTGHAVGLTADNGLELLIHVGLDTVQLEGKYYEACVTEHARVKKGDLLIRFDMEQIKNAGYNVITPVIVSNTDDYEKVTGITGKKVSWGDLIIKTGKGE